MKTRKAKPVTVEVLPSPARMLQATMDEATLQKLVQQKVAEILTARDDLIFEPFFRSQQVTFEIRRLQTVPEIKKWTVFYERYGCHHCGKSERPHGACGFCSTCRLRVYRQLRGIDRELIKESDGQENNAAGRALLRRGLQTSGKP
jgi:hypothetical protein